MTYVKVFKFRKKNVMSTMLCQQVNNVKGLFEVDKQGTNRALVIKSLHPLMLDSNYSACVVDLPGRQPNWFSSRSGSNDGMSQSLTYSPGFKVTVIF